MADQKATHVAYIGNAFSAPLCKPYSITLVRHNSIRHPQRVAN